MLSFLSTLRGCSKDTESVHVFQAISMSLYWQKAIWCNRGNLVESYCLLDSVHVVQVKPSCSSSNTEASLPDKLYTCFKRKKVPKAPDGIVILVTETDVRRSFMNMKLWKKSKPDGGPGGILKSVHINSYLSKNLDQPQFSFGHNRSMRDANLLALHWTT